MNDLFLILIILILVIINALSIYFLIELWKWRKKINESSIVLPDQFHQDVNNLSKNIVLHKNQLNHIDKKFIEKLNDFNAVLSSTVNKNSEYFQNIFESINPIKLMISNQDKEIKRLREGYNNSVKKDLILKLIDLKERIDFYTIKDNKESKIKITDDVVSATQNILKVLNYVFKTEGVKELKFSNNDLIDKIDSSEIEVLPQNCIETDDSSLVGKIESTIKVGFYIDGLDNQKFILKKAQVKYYGEIEK